MGFESGSASFRVFYAPGGQPGDCLERFARCAAPPLDKLGSDPISGWVTGRHLLDRDIREETAIMAGFLRLTLMKAERKIPESLLRAECKMEEFAEMAAKGVATLDRGTRAEIKRSVTERLFPNMPPTLTGIPLVWKNDADQLYAGALSEKQNDALLIAFQQAVSQPLVPMTPAAAAMRRKQIDVRVLGPTSFSPEFEHELMGGETIGEDFLTWLWFFSEARGGIARIPDIGEFGVMLEGPLLFFRDGDGAHETQLRNGMPLVSSEAKTALLSGKKLRRAKLTLALGDASWTVSFDAREFIFRGLKPPKAQPMDAISRFEQRMFSIRTFTDALLGFYDRFLDERTDADAWSKTVAEIHKWVADRQGRA